MAVVRQLIKMKPDDIFGIVVRTIGVLLLLYGLWYLTFALAESMGIVAGQTRDEAKLLFITATAAIVVALILMRAADWVVRFSYPETTGVQQPFAAGSSDEGIDIP